MDNLNNDKQHYLAKLHNDILAIMDEINRICEVHHIRYYLMCGSCLGAVRHKGFIPWDDDLDIAMPREDFNIFIDVLNQQNVLDNRFYLRWITTEKYYNQDFAKVCLKNTMFQEYTGKASKNAGIFVDVFPLDSCAKYSKKIEIKSRLYNHLHSCLFLKGVDKSYMDWKIKHWPRNIIAKCFSNRFIYKIMLLIISPQKENKCDYQALYSTPYPIKRQLFPKKWHGVGKRMQFENRLYICPDEPDKLMQYIYGDNYMELPPIEKRKMHYPIRVVFSDGEQIEFEKTNNIIKYEDIIN